jgi:hypothetical protein
VSLRGADLGQVGQDTWLTKCDMIDYPHTRTWGEAIRGWAPWAAGFVWRSRRDEDKLAYVFFDSVCGSDSFVDSGHDSLALDSKEGVARVQDLLRRYNVVLSPA